MMAEKTGKSQSVLIRDALDDYIAKNGSDKVEKQRAFLSGMKGLWADRNDLADFIETVRGSADSRLLHLHQGLSDQEQEVFDHENHE